MNISISLAILLAMFSQVVTAANSVVRLGTTTSVQSSGLLSRIKPAFERDTGLTLQYHATGSGKAIQLARDGRFDAIITHAPAAEQKLTDQGYVQQRTPFMRNFFLIVGPQQDPAQISGIMDAAQALRQIAVKKTLFISRADDSGTHRREIILWKNAGIEPLGSWYFESGLGMGKALQLASDKQAYILVDNSTWLAQRKIINLQEMTHDPKHLENTYSIILLSKNKLPNLNHEGARAFATWLLSEKGAVIIRDMLVNDKPLFSLITQ